MHTEVPPRESWSSPLSIDLLSKVLHTTVLHPFLVWLLPLCLAAQATPWNEPWMLAFLGWASLVSLSCLAGALNRRVAYGLPREVDLSEEVVVVTGGGSGLGLLVAEVYGMRGATVAVLDVRRGMEGGEGRGVRFYECDVGDGKRVAEVAMEIERDLGTPTILINNAAIVIGKSFLNLSLDEIDTSLRTNLLGPFYCLKAFLPAMLRSGRGGTIVNISSVIGHLGAAQLTDYAAAKAGLTALHRSLTAELREKHPEIRTVLITPGQLSTPLFHGVKTPSRFFAPVVEPVDVAREIIAAVDGGRSAEIRMPLYARWVDWYHVLPAGVQVVVRALAGVDRGMKTFVGRGEEASKLGRGQA